LRRKTGWCTKMKTMDIDDNDLDSNGREKAYFAFRPFKDQMDDLEWLIIHKYHNNRTKADCCRDALDQFIEHEKK
jgi:hypothetical protein